MPDKKRADGVQFGILWKKLAEKFTTEWHLQETEKARACRAILAIAVQEEKEELLVQPWMSVRRRREIVSLNSAVVESNQIIALCRFFFQESALHDVLRITF